MQDETLNGKWVWRSPISSKPSALIVEGIKADYFALNAWKTGFEAKKSNSMSERNGLFDHPYQINDTDQNYLHYFPHSNNVITQTKQGNGH